MLRPPPIRWALLLLLLPLRAAVAQDARLTARLPETTAREVLHLADSAQGLGLPTEPLIQKALEGQSKGADGARIVIAVRALLLNLGRARAALGTGVGNEDVIAGAQALRLGATAAQLHDLQGIRGDRPLTVPLSVLTDLLAAGVPVERAWRSVMDVARQGGEDRQFERLRDVAGPGTVRP